MESRRELYQLKQLIPFAALIRHECGLKMNGYGHFDT